VFLVVNAALGAGLLNFPDAYQQAGGVLIAVLIQAVSIYIIHCILMSFCSKKY
jgi:sodium-coupled neutral amino acid transporter 7/8